MYYRLTLLSSPSPLLLLSSPLLSSPSPLLSSPLLYFAPHMSSHQIRNAISYTDIPKYQHTSGDIRIDYCGGIGQKPGATGPADIPR
jgi:hypothetical protein